jgi:hypothetical protein
MSKFLYSVPGNDSEMRRRSDDDDESVREDDPQRETAQCGPSEPLTDGGEDIDIEPESFEWVCQECGRRHPKHSPPCSRCGHMNLEKEPISYDVDDAEAASYLELGKFHIAAVVVLVAFVGLVAAGVITLPQFAGSPSIEDAPGEGERVAGIDLTVAETQVREELNEYRAENGRSAFEADADLDEIATYHNRHRAVAAHEDDAVMPDPRDDWSEFDYQCSRAPVLQSIHLGLLGEPGRIDAHENETALAEAVAGGLVRGQAGETSLLADWDAIAVDLHVYPDGTIYVALAVC